MLVRDARTGMETKVRVSHDFSGTPYIDAGCLAALGIRLFDPAFRNTAVTRSSICWVDGEKGELLYRGYPIEQLVAKSSFLESAYLLIYGELPNTAALTEWTRGIMTHTAVHVGLESMMRTFHYDAHPMGMFISSMAALSAFHADANPSLQTVDMYMGRSPAATNYQNKQIKRILGKASTIAAHAYRHRIGRAFNLPQAGLGYVENLLMMCDAMGDGATFRPHPTLVEALETLFIVHAEHEMNCSTAAMRHLTSSRVDPYAGVAGSAAALYGPLHGGANEGVLEMLQEIGTVGRIPDFLAAVKRKECRLIGFGHRVYRADDPRARIVKDVMDKVFRLCGHDPLVEIALALEEAARHDEYFIARKLYANVDFWTGLCYRAMGFPPDFFPLLFAVPRCVGWMAHWREACRAEDESGIWRPRQLYDGPARRDYMANASDHADGESLTFSESGSMYRRYQVSKSQPQ